MSVDEIVMLTEFLASVDMTQWDIADQLVVTGAHVELMEKIKPVLLKYMAREKEVPSFLIRL